MTLLPINATALEKSIEESLERTTDLPVIINQLWNPQTCPSELLPWLAWSLSVDYWNMNWSDEIKRKVIASSIDTHRYKGTGFAVKKALLPLGLSVDIDENIGFYTFVVLIFINSDKKKQLLIFDNRLYQTISYVVNRVKPSRCHYQLKIKSSFSRALAIKVRFRGQNLVINTMDAKSMPLYAKVCLNLTIRYQVLNVINTAFVVSNTA